MTLYKRVAGRTVRKAIPSPPPLPHLMHAKVSLKNSIARRCNVRTCTEYIGSYYDKFNKNCTSRAKFMNPVFITYGIMVFFYNLFFYVYII